MPQVLKLVNRFSVTVIFIFANSEHGWWFLKPSRLPFSKDVCYSVIDNFFFLFPIFFPVYFINSSFTVFSGGSSNCRSQFYISTSTLTRICRISFKRLVGAAGPRGLFTVAIKNKNWVKKVVIPGRISCCIFFVGIRKATENRILEISWNCRTYRIETLFSNTFRNLSWWLFREMIKIILN